MHGSERALRALLSHKRPRQETHEGMRPPRAWGGAGGRKSRFESEEEEEEESEDEGSESEGSESEDGEEEDESGEEEEEESDDEEADSSD